MNKANKKVATAPCPDCEQIIYLGLTAKEGQNVTCPNCWAYLKIVSLEPLELRWDIESDEWEEKEQ